MSKLYFLLSTFQSNFCALVPLINGSNSLLLLVFHTTPKVLAWKWQWSQKFIWWHCHFPNIKVIYSYYFRLMFLHNQNRLIKTGHQHLNLLFSVCNLHQFPWILLRELFLFPRIKDNVIFFISKCTQPMVVSHVVKYLIAFNEQNEQVSCIFFVNS